MPLKECYAFKRMLWIFSFKTTFNTANKLPINTIFLLHFEQQIHAEVQINKRGLVGNGQWYSHTHNERKQINCLIHQPVFILEIY